MHWQIKTILSFLVTVAIWFFREHWLHGVMHTNHTANLRHVNAQPPSTRESIGTQRVEVIKYCSVYRALSSSVVACKASKARRSSPGDSRIIQELDECPSIISNDVGLIR
jgi:hypothetical protein